MDADSAAAEIEHAWLTLIRREAALAFDQHMRPGGMPRRAYNTVLRLAEWGPTPITVLAAAEGVDISTMSRLVKRLQDMQLVRRARGQDRRQVFISVTDAGQQTLKEWRAARRRIIAEVVSDWTGEERREYVQLIKRFSGGIARFAASRAPAEPAGEGRAERPVAGQAAASVPTSS